MTSPGSHWGALPSPVIETVLSFLHPRDRCRAGQTSRTWHQCCSTPSVWRTLTFTFIDPTRDELFLDFVHRFIPHMRALDILVDQFEEKNRRNVCRLLGMLSPTGQLRSVKVMFIGENPLFYAGKDFLDELEHVFKGRRGIREGQLRHVDLHGLPININTAIVDILAGHNPHLETLDIANQVIVCMVHPDAILRLLEQCRNITSLRLYHCSITEDVLRALSKPDRSPIRNIAIFCRKEQTLIKEVPSEVWSELANQCPDLRVTLGFDHTCPLDKVSAVMARDIPVKELLLETHTGVGDEVSQAASHYSRTLEKVVLQTWNSPHLADSLIHLCGSCSHLHTLLVYCVLERRVVEAILRLCPVMKQRGTYILRWTLDPEPWVMGGRRK